MSLELSQITLLRKNTLASAAVGDLSSEACDYLKTTTALVFITGERVRHIDALHSDLSDFEIITMAYGLRHGLIIGDVGRPNCVIINYMYPDNGVRYKIAVKAARGGRELWVSTFHRLRPRQTRALLKRGVIIRTHD